jgi:DNA-binding MarR family transcriptional regulator
MRMPSVAKDRADQFISQWREQRPELDVSPFAVVSRVLMLYKHLEQSADRRLAPFGLTLWQFDILAALRRAGAPFTLSPTQLTGLAALSSGAMTNRIDRLEEMELVCRRPDPRDRRGLLIQLTAKGRRLVDKALPVRLDGARADIEALSPEEQQLVGDLLRRLLATFEGNPRDADDKDRLAQPGSASRPTVAPSPARKYAI